jgi:hypothetical protein
MGRICITDGDKMNSYRILVGKPEGMRPLEDLDVDGWIILKWVLERQVGVVWIGLIWPRIETYEMLFLTFGFHKILETSEVTTHLAPSQEGLRSMELVSLCLDENW